MAGFTALSLDVTNRGALARLDVRVARWNAAHMPSWAEWAARPFSWGGGALGMAVVTVLGAVWLVRSHTRGDAVLLAAAYGVVELGTVGLKHAFHRPRPDVGSAIPLPHSFSFPSGHTSGAFATLVLAAVLLQPRAQRFVAQSHKLWTALAVVLATAIAASRVVLNVHYVSDVVAGACVGLAVCSGALLTRRPRSREHPERVAREPYRPSDEQP